MLWYILYRVLWSVLPVRTTRYIVYVYSRLCIIGIYYSRLGIALGYGHISLLSLEDLISLVDIVGFSKTLSHGNLF